MTFRSATLSLCLVLLMVAPALAQFTGPSVQGRGTSVAAVQEVRIGTYVTLTGRITAHLRENYYHFADDTGEIRVEIPGQAWQGRSVGPDAKITIMGEVDRTLAGRRYVWVKSLDMAK